MSKAKKQVLPDLSVDQMISSGLLRPGLFSEPAPPPPAPPAPRTIGDEVSDMGSALWQGAKSTARAVGSSVAGLTGNKGSVEENAAAQQEDYAKGPAAKRELMEEIARRKEANPEADVLSAISDVAGAALGNLRGTGQLVVEQAPNAAVALGSGVAGAKAGAAAGAAFGPAGAAVGGIGGFLAGMFLGNYALEAGHKLMEKAEGGLTDEEVSQAGREGATKAGVITAVDAATLGAGRLAARAINSPAVRAGARAEAKVLSDAGVDITKGSAIVEALAKNAPLRAQAQAAGKAAANAASTIKGRAATAGTLAAGETAGEFTGEYVGEYAATGEADPYDAAIEAIAGLAQSAPEVAWAMSQSSGNKLDPAGILGATPGLEPVVAKAAEPNSPLSKAATAGVAAAPAPSAPAAPVDPAARLAELEAIGRGSPESTAIGPDGNPVTIPAQPGRFFTEDEQAEYQSLVAARDATPGAAPSDPIAGAVAQIQERIRTGGLLDALRAEDSPVEVKAFLNDLAVASSPSTSKHLREQALTRLEFAAGWAGDQPAAEASPVIDQVLGRPEGAQRSAPTTPAQRRAGADRDKQLQDRLAAATTDFERNEIRAQMEVNRQVKLGKPEGPAQGRAQSGSERPQSGSDQARLEAAALAGEERARKAADAPRQVVISRAMRSIEERGGVASPAEAQILAEAGLGKPYDRIDETLAGELPVDQKLTQATGIALDKAPRSTATQQADPTEAELAAQEQRDRSDSRMQRLDQEREAKKATTDAAEATKPDAPPAADDVIAALKVIPSLRDAAQKMLVSKARSSYTPEQMRVLNDAANVPANLSATDKLELEQLRGVRKSAARRGWWVSDNDLPTKESAENIIKARRRMAQNPRLSSAWDDYEMRAVPSDNAGLWAVENRRIGDDSDESQLAKSAGRDAAQDAQATKPVAPRRAVIPAGAEPAFVRKRRAQLELMADMGFETVARTDVGFVMRNTLTGRELPLDGAADAQIARQAIKAHVDKAAARADVEPSPAQIEADNYRKGQPFQLNGVTIIIENPKGSVRKSKPGAKVQWETTMKHHYGDIMGTKGADGDKVDVFVGPRPDSDRIFVIDQRHEGGGFDEHKVMMGFVSEAEARAAYLANFDNGWTGLMAITEMTPEAFKAWVNSDATSRAASESGKMPATKESADADRQADDTAGGRVRAAAGGAEAGRRGLGDDQAQPVAGAGGAGRDAAPDFRLGEAADRVVARFAGGIVELPLVKTPKEGPAALLSAIGAAVGRSVRFYVSRRQADNSDAFTVQSDPSTIYIALDAGVSPLQLLFHEFWHTLERQSPRAARIVRDALANGADRDAWLTMRRFYPNQPEPVVQEEFRADLAGVLMSDQAFWQEVFSEANDKGVIARIVAALERMIDQALSVFKGMDGYDTAQYVKDMGAIRSAYKAALKQHLKDAGISQTAMQAEILRATQEAKRSAGRAYTPAREGLDGQGLGRDAGGVTPAARGADAPAASYGRPQEGSVSATGVHFGREARGTLSSAFYGTGLKGAERERLEGAENDDIRPRIFFYVDKGNGVRAEAGVGPHAHRVELKNLYDVWDDPLGLRKANQGANNWERAIMKAGFDGYLSMDPALPQGFAVLVGKKHTDVPAEVVPAPGRQDAAPSAPTEIREALMSRELREIDTSRIPGARVDASGTLIFPADSREQANAEMERIGSYTRFSRERLATPAEQLAAVRAEHEGKPTWMKAPNGKPTNLNERQWLHVRTPSFKKWFGDWEAFAGDKSGVWADADGAVSKAVDENGEPLVVYHGTDTGGFAVFRAPSGSRRGDLGIFTTSDKDMATSYARLRRSGGTFRADDVAEQDDVLYEVSQSGDKYYVRDGSVNRYWGGRVGWVDGTERAVSFDDREEAEAEAEVLGDDALNDRRNLSGVYALFINLRNPQEENFEGANWDGSRAGMWAVVTTDEDGDQEHVYSDDGRAYFDDREDAFALAMSKGGEVVEAEDHYQSTDGAVREARKYGNDGAILREVRDDGGGRSLYWGRPADSFVAFDPNQLKSADFNGGEYSATDADIRKSESREYRLDIDREDRASGKAARLTPAEVAAVEKDADLLGLSDEQVKAVLKKAREDKMRFPQGEGWAPIELIGVALKIDPETGLPRPGTEYPKFQPIAYNFNKPPGAKRAPPKRDEAWLAKVADKFEGLIVEVLDRANAGDKNAQTIVAHQTWYRNVAAVLRREYGGFGDLLADLLGATSPNTPVDTNWAFSLDAMRRFLRGDFNDELARFQKWVDSGKSVSKFPNQHKVRQASGKLYGMNSDKAMRAMLDLWRLIEPGTAPKARNFALNLIGQSNMATIDVWAARMLRRAADMVRGASFPRIPPPAEMGVTGTWDAKGKDVTGAFGFGAAVMDRVSKRLKERGIDIDPPDLQAVAWFVEKELWGRKGWTTKTGEGGSFEEQIEKTPVDRYIAGWSIQQGERRPSSEDMSLAQARVISILSGDDSVLAARAAPTLGLYAGTVESSFDTEWTAMRASHDPRMAMAEIARLAAENDQWDIFVSRVVPPNESNANARPGVEIYFKDKRSLDQAMPVLEAFTSRGQDGFTMVVDPRTRGDDKFIGVRLQYVPEISARWDEEARARLLEDGGLEAELEDKAERLHEIAREVEQLDGVAHSASLMYDTVVVGKESYGEFIGSIAAGSDQEARGEAWFGRPVREAVEGAVARYQGDGRQDDAGRVPDAGSELLEGEEGVDFDSSLPRSIRLAGSASASAARDVVRNPDAAALADEMLRAMGREPVVPPQNRPLPTRLMQDLGDRYEDASDQDPDSPEIERTYRVFERELMEQARAILDHGIDVEPFDGQGEPYANAGEMTADVVKNKHLYFLKTGSALGSGGAQETLRVLRPSGMTLHGYKLSYNDVIRFVHDYFGHTPEGYAFGPRGEFNAFLTHAQMFSEAARPALMAELLMQAGWFFNGRHIRRADRSTPKPGDDDFVPYSKRAFIDPKNVLPTEDQVATANALLADVTKSASRDDDSFRQFLGDWRSKMVASLEYGKLLSRQHEWSLNVGDKLLSTKTGKIYTLTGRTFQRVGPVKANNWQPVYSYETGEPPPASASREEVDAWDKEYQRGIFPERAILESKTLKSLTTPILKSTRRDFIMGAAAALAAAPARAGTTLGRAVPLSRSVMGSRVSPAAEKLLRGNGATNPAGHDALKAAMAEIAANGPQELRALAAEIGKLLPGKGVMLTVDDKSKLNVSGLVELRPLPHLTLFTADGRAGLSHETVLHEALHVAVAARYRSLSMSMLRRNDALLKQPAPRAAEAMEQLRMLWGEFRDIAWREEMADDKTMLALDQASRSPDEFFVRALTDPHLQAWMAGKRYQGKTLWGRFKDWVKTSLLGFESGTAPSWLDAALLASADMASAMVLDRDDWARLRAANEAQEGQQVRKSAARDVTDTPEFKAWFGGSKVVDENGNPLVVYHGSTHEFEAFKPRKTSAENDFGRGIYATSSKVDVSENYAGEGPDLTSRITRRAEQIALDRGWEYDDPRAVERARKELSGGAPNVMPLYLRIENPLVLGGDESHMDDRAARKFARHIDKAVRQQEIDTRGADAKPSREVDIQLSDLMESAYDGAPAGVLVAKARNVAAYMQDLRTGDMISGEVIRRAIQAAGYDGIIDHTVSRKWGADSHRENAMAGVDAGTTHYIAFKADQVKSAIGNSGEFDPKSKDITKSAARWTDKRIDNLMSRYAYTMDDTRTKAYAAWVSPSDFLAATTPDDGVARLESENKPLDRERLAYEDQPIMLIGELQDSKIFVTRGHEGRHRMMALRDAGVDRVPVVFDLGGGVSNREPLMSHFASPQRWSGGPKAQRGFLTGTMVPISYKYKDELKRRFGPDQEMDRLRRQARMEPEVAFSRARAFHGTAIRGIDQFSTDKIGTGEGAQAYGWGLYFAGKKEVAEFYRQKLQGGPLGVRVMDAANRALGVSYGEATSAADFLDIVGAAAGNGEDAVRKAIIQAADKMARSPFDATKQRGEAVRALASNAAVVKAINEEAAGQLYEVNIPGDDELLLWDKPLSEQPEDVRRALVDIANSQEDDSPFARAAMNDYVGSHLYHALALQVRRGGDSTVDSQRAASEMLAEFGIRGIKYLDGGSRAGGAGTYNYVIFDGNDVDVVGTFYSASRALDGGLGGVNSAQEHWASPGASKFDDLVYKLQDKHIDTKRVVDAVKDAHGTLRDDLNVYLQEELFHGRAAKRTDDFVHKELEPLIADMGERGLTLADLDEYLHARHAKEANAVIRQRNPDLKDGGSGMTDAEADAYFDQLGVDKLDHLKAAAEKVDAMIAKTRKLMVDYELVSKKQVRSWGEMFQHYVPLMREDEGGHSGGGTGQGFSIKGKEVKGRTGSTRKVVDILANIAMQRERTIVRGEKNRVSRALFGLAATYDNKDFWKVDTHIPTERVFNEKTGLVEDRPNNLFKQQPNVVVTKMADEEGNVSERAVIFNEKNERAMRMAEALKNLDAAALEGLMGASARLTRYFASVNTQYNPVFGVVNLVRDVQGAMVNLGSTELAGKQKAIAMQTLSALRGIYGDLRAVRKGGEASSDWAHLWEDFQGAGGQTGYRDLFRTSEDRAKAIERALDPTAWMDSKLGRIFTANGALKVPLAAAQRGAKWIFDWLSDYNEAMENGVRLATYKAGLDAGMSKERAASLAKNLTVNFNRKGQVAQQAGALYAFFNASAQGTARLGQVLFDMDPGKPKTIRLSGLGKKVVYGGMLLGSIQALALAAAGFGEDDPPEWARERSLIIPVGDKKYITIPLPLGLHVIPNIGRTTTAWALSGFKDTTKRALGLAGSLADAFNPIGNAGMSMQTLSPTALDPLVALTENRDWSGRPIARESSNRAIPGYTLARDTSSTVGKVVAEAINYLSGGTRYTAGVMSPTPDQIDYLIGQLTGGVGRELGKVEQSLLGAAHGETVPIYKVPLVGRFVGNARSQASEGNAFYANVERLNELETELKGLRNDGRHAEANELRLKNPQAYLITQANHAERQVQKLRKQKSELVKAGAPREEVKAIEAKITARMAALNRAVAALEER